MLNFFAAYWKAAYEGHGETSDMALLSSDGQ